MTFKLSGKRRYIWKCIDFEIFQCGLKLVDLYMNQMNSAKRKII